MNSKGMHGSNSYIRLSGQLSYTSCAVRAGLKPAVLFHLRDIEAIDTWCRFGERMLREAGLHAHKLRACTGCLALMIYRPDLMIDTLSKPEARHMLDAYHYPSSRDIDACLCHLTARYDIADYPHEVGLFLGYPAHDVQGYIDNQGEDYLARRYWKVYGDLDGACELFMRIDHLKQAAAKRYIACVDPSL